MDPVSSNHAEELDAIDHACLQEREKFEYEIALALHRFKQSCAVCTVFDIVNPVSHPLVNCPTLSQKEGPEGLQRWKAMLRYPDSLDLLVCHRCHVPLVKRLHQTERSICPFEDVISPLAYAILINPEKKRQARRYFKDADISTKDAAAIWVVGERSEKDGLGLSNAIELLLWYYRTY